MSEPASRYRQIEREWTDQFGDHWEVRQLGGDGKIHSMKLTRPRRGGWNPNWDEARAAVARSAASVSTPL